MRTKGAKNKTIPETPAVIVTKDESISFSNENLHTKQDIPKEDPPKQEAPQVIIKEVIKEVIKKPKKEVKKDIPHFELEQIQDPIKMRGLNKKYVLFGLTCVGVALVIWKKDEIIEKILEWKQNRILSNLEKEGIENIDIKGDN